MKVTLIGAGGHAQVVIAAAEASGWEVTSLLDEDSNSTVATVCGVPVLKLPQKVDVGPLHIAIGSNAARSRLSAERPEADWVQIIHPSAVVESQARIGLGTLVGMGALIQAGAQIGSHVIVNTGAIVEHHCVVEDFCHLAPGVVLAGGVVVETGALVGLGARALPGVRIGRNAIVGAGAVVTRDVPPGVTVVGVPACEFSRAPAKDRP